VTKLLLLRRVDQPFFEPPAFTQAVDVLFINTAIQIFEVFFLIDLPRSKE
jgi:hypothetical protein